MPRTLLLLLGTFLAVLCQAQAARIVFSSTGTNVNQHPFVVFNPDNSRRRTRDVLGDRQLQCQRDDASWCYGGCPDHQERDGTQ